MQELTFGVYDGVSGLVTLPRRGLKDSGAKGFIQGVGNGVGGFLSKPVAGSCIVPLVLPTWTSLALEADI
jgi:hypothetical protein